MQTEMILGKEIGRIGKDYFAGCADLKRVIILNPRLMLPAEVFRDCPNVVICAHGGSFAEFYAKQHGFTFERL